MSDANPRPTTPEIKNPRKWTVMLYLAGDNNLSEECVYALTEAKEVLSDNNPKLTVVAQFDPNGVRAETKRYLLSKTRTLEEDAAATGWKARETDTGEPQNLLEFIRWTISQFAAENYLVVLAGHGSGTDDDFLLRDENPPNNLSIKELQEVFTQLTNDGHTIDILGMDTCVMSMAEVCFELNRTSITYLVGSEGFTPNTGWPYAAILRELGRKIDVGGATPLWLARQIVEEHRNFYVPYINGGISVDQSVVELAKINGLKNKMFTLVETLLTEIQADQLNYGMPKQDALLLAHWEAQSYNGEVFVDLRDFCDRLALRYPRTPPSNVKGNCEAVSTAVGDVVVRSCVSGAAFQFSFGLSIYFPWAILSPRYENLSFPKETKWLDFLKKYHEKTRRPGRRGQLREETVPPGRASIPTNKGRNGRVDSMRNPPSEEFKGCSDVVLTTGGNGPKAQRRKSQKRKAKKRPRKV